jgi:hypothetical protein
MIVDPSLTEEIHQVQEDKARTVLQEVLKEKTVDQQVRDRIFCSFTVHNISSIIYLKPLHKTKSLKLAVK